MFEQRGEEESSEEAVDSQVPATPPEVIHSLRCGGVVDVVEGSGLRV